MPTFLKFGILLLLNLCAGPVWSSAEQPDQIPPRWASWFSAQGVQINAQPVQASVHQTNFTWTSYPPPVALVNVRDLSLEDRPRTQGVLTSTTWPNGAFVTETEMANNQRRNSIPGDIQDDSANRMMRIDLSATS